MLNENFEFNVSGSILGGANSIKKLSKICKSFGSQILLVSYKDITNIVDRAINILHSENFSITEFYLESPEPTSAFIDSSIQKLSSKKFDCIVGLGGGSAIDMSKTLSIGLTHTSPIWEYANLSYRPPRPLIHDLIPIVAIPTTAGTGSEVTPYAVVNNMEIKQRGTIKEPAIIPKIAIVDPTLMVSLPNELTISTGLDAFAHALESYLSISKKSPVSELMGVESLRLIFENLPKVLKDPSNLELRMKMAWASTLSGLAISHRGTTTPHAIAETMGGLVHIPHGHAVAISTYPVLKETLSSTTSKISRLYEQVFLDIKSDLNDKDKSNLFLENVKKLLVTIRFDKHLTDFHPELKNDFSDKVIEYLLKYKFRPLKEHLIEFNKENLKKVIREIVYG